MGIGNRIEYDLIRIQHLYSSEYHISSKFQYTRILCINKWNGLQHYIHARSFDLTQSCSGTNFSLHTSIVALCKLLLSLVKTEFYFSTGVFQLTPYTRNNGFQSRVSIVLGLNSLLSVYLCFHDMEMLLIAIFTSHQLIIWIIHNFIGVKMWECNASYLIDSNFQNYQH